MAIFPGLHGPPTSGFACECGENGQKETLSFARTGSGGNDDVFLVADDFTEGPPLVFVQSAVCGDKPRAQLGTAGISIPQGSSGGGKRVLRGRVHRNRLDQRFEREKIGAREPRSPLAVHRWIAEWEGTLDIHAVDR